MTFTDIKAQLRAGVNELDALQIPENPGVVIEARVESVRRLTILWREAVHELGVDVAARATG